MHIEKLQLMNFGSHRQSSLLFDAPITLVYGNNATGKTSIADAIEYALVGRCRGTDAKGAGIEQIIADGTEMMKVGLTLRDGAEREALVIQRGVKGHSSALEVNGEGGPIGVRQAFLVQQLATTEAILSALCNSRAFLNLGHADAKALLLKVCDVKVTVEGQALSLEQLETRYQEAFDQRRTAKARLSDLKVPPAPDTEEPDIAALDATLAELRDEEKRQLAAAAKDDGRRATLERQHQDACNDLARLEQALERTEDLTSKIEALDERIALLEPNEGAETALQKCRTAIAAADGRLPMLERTLTQIEEHDPKKGCVLDGAIPCKTASSHFAGQVSKLQNEVMNLKAQKDTAVEALEVQRRATAERDRLEADLKSLQQRQRARAELDARRTSLTATRDKVHDEIAALPPPAQKSHELEALQQRIARGEQTIREARSVADAWTRHRETSAEEAKLAKKVADLERRVEQLGPKGLRVEALSAAVFTFEALINNALSKFGYELHFQIDPWTVIVNGRSAIRLSESERLRVGLSLQLALADVTHLGFVVIDGADLLDGRNRGVLVELLDSWEGQAIVTATRDDAPEPMEGIGIYWLTLDRGVTQVERIGAEVAA
jgi:DNA repair exonuclease SbcCD ATPase subunit